jgi:hypothetical protein
MIDLVTGDVVDIPFTTVFCLKLYDDVPLAEE